MRIILASQSESRKELMDLIKLDYEIIVSNAEEKTKEGLSIEEQSKELSYIKAKKVFEETQGDRIVIGSDTMVIQDNKLYGKPKDEKEAFGMLKKFQNSRVQFITSITVIIEQDGKYIEKIDYDKTDVYLKPMTDVEIEKYITTGETLKKAGGFAVQSEFCVFIDKIVGNYTTAVGLPTHKLYDMIIDYI